MKKLKLMRIILLVICGLLLISVFLVMWMHREGELENVIEVRIREESVETVEFETLCLIPGEQCTYTISLTSEEAKKFDLTLDFVETEEKTLKNFAFVRIEFNEQVIYDKLLAEAFEDTEILLPVEFKQNSNTELVVIYYLPEEVGNEAQNAEAIFELQIIASNE